MKNLNWSLFCFISIIFTPSHAQEDIGKFLTAKFTDVVNTSDVSRGVKRKDGIVLHETIKTQNSVLSVAELWTIDDSRFSLNPNSSLTFTELDISADGCTGMKATLAYGKFRGSSGKCSGKTEIKTHIASAYAWGTDHEIVYIPEGRTIVGYEDVKPGLYEKVNEGQVLIKNGAGNLMVKPGEVGFIGSKDEAPRIIPMPNFFTVASLMVSPEDAGFGDTNNIPTNSSSPLKVRPYAPIAKEPRIVEKSIVDRPSIFAAKKIDSLNKNKERNKERKRNSAPIFTETTFSANFDENATEGTIIDINAVDLQGNRVTYELIGEDASNFTINSDGVITLIDPLDYEIKDTYNLVVKASDGELTTDVPVVINVNDLDEGAGKFYHLSVKLLNNDPGQVSQSDHQYKFSYNPSIYSGDEKTIAKNENGEIIFMENDNNSFAYRSLGSTNIPDINKYSGSYELDELSLGNSIIHWGVWNNGTNSRGSSGAADYDALVYAFEEREQPLYRNYSGNMPDRGVYGLHNHPEGVVLYNNVSGSPIRFGEEIYGTLVSAYADIDFNNFGNNSFTVDGVGGVNDNPYSLNLKPTSIYSGQGMQYWKDTNLSIYPMGENYSHLGATYAGDFKLEDGTSVGNGAGAVIFGQYDNSTPTLVSNIVDASTNQYAGYSFDSSVHFSDMESDNGIDELSYSATLSDGSALPSWLSIDSVTGVLSEYGPVILQETTLAVTVTATDGSGEGVSDTFDLTINPTEGLADTAWTRVTHLATTDTFSSSNYIGYQANGYPIALGKDSNGLIAGVKYGDSYTTTGGSTIHLGGYAHYGNNEFIYVTEEEPIFTPDTVPTTGTLNYNVVSATPVWTGQTNNQHDDVYETLTSAPLSINLASNTVNLASINTSGGSYSKFNTAGTLQTNSVGSTSFQIDGVPNAEPNQAKGLMMGVDLSNIGMIYNAQLVLNNGNYGQRAHGAIVFEKNYQPVLTSNISDIATNEDSSYSFDSSTHFSDLENNYGASLSYSATLSDGSALPAWLSIHSGTGVLSGTSADGDVGVVAVTVTAIDNLGESIFDTFDLTVNNTDDKIIKVSAYSIPTQSNQASFSSENMNDVDVANSNFDYTTIASGALDVFSGTNTSDGKDWDVQAYDVSTSQTGIDGVIDHGSYATSSNTTIDWGIWSAALDTSYNADGSIDQSDVLDSQIHVFEDRRNISADISLPITGTVNYDIADQSVVAIKDTTTGTWLSNGVLDSADMNINFATNTVDTQFVITDDTNTQITSDVITGTLNPTNGLIVGQSGGFNYLADNGAFTQAANPTLSQGNGAFIGNMMGTNGSHAGVAYAVELGNDDKVGAGVVVFEAQ